jgi:hypothetical protein
MLASTVSCGETNNDPKPFVWTADPDAIIEKFRRGKQVLESIDSHVRLVKIAGA